MFSKIIFTLFTAAVATVLVRGESHTITFINKCGYGTPYLWGPGGALLSTGDAYTSNGPADDLIAYLQIGVCGDNGENCTLIGATLSNDDGSSGYISLIPPHAFSVASGWGFYNGCDGIGADCTYSECPEAVHNASQALPQVLCAAADLDLVILFCD